MSIKNESRLRRAKKTRMRIKSQDLPRLTVFKSSQHIYAQIIDSSGAKVLAATSTLDKSIKSKGRSVNLLRKLEKRLLICLSRMVLRKLFLIDQDIDITEG